MSRHRWHRFLFGSYGSILPIYCLPKSTPFRMAHSTAFGLSNHMPKDACFLRGVSLRLSHAMSVTRKPFDVNSFSSKSLDIASRLVSRLT